jgi:Holliday junction resolvase
LGIKFEETVELILKKRGYTTEMRQKLEGNSGALNEIDVLAKRQNKVLAVECKNYKESRLVGIKEIRDFESKILDLPYITDAMFVTNTRFSSEAETYAKHNEITLYDGEKLKNEFYLMSIGRLDSSSPSSSAAIPQQDIILEFALPLTMNYRQATRLDLVNSYSAKISYAALILSPFYVFNYIVDVKRRLLISRGLHKEGTHIVDAMTGEILSIIEKIESKIQSYPFFSKRNVRPKDSDEILDRASFHSFTAATIVLFTD